MLKTCRMWDILFSFCAGIGGALVVYAGLARKVWNLQCDIAATQAQLLRERNQRASLTRSKDKEALEVLKDLNNSAPTVPKVNPLRKFGIGS